MGALERFFRKWGPGGLERSLTRKRLRRERADTYKGTAGASTPAVLQLFQSAPERKPATDVKALVRARFLSLKPLPTYLIPEPGGGRVTVITDSINSGSLYGGVGTAVILAALLCEARDQRLRIITRSEAAEPHNLHRVLQTYGIELEHDPQFAFSPPEDPGTGVDIIDDELFITTSWWTTAATIGTVPERSILYLLQEDERMFYPHGDDRLRCEQIMSRSDLAFAINSRLLHEHLVGSGLSNIERNGLCFEPAFPRDIFYPRQRPGKMRFMFYARPNNARNLFYLGMEAIDRAIDEGLLNADNWELLLVGKDIPEIVFDSGIHCVKFENLRWNAYADLIGTVDLGLCLMYTPHPSYPPLDLAVSGGVVVTNTCLNKQDMSQYSDNIIAADLDVESLVQAIGRGVALAMDRVHRQQNHAATRVGSSWREALAPIVARYSS